MRIDHINRLARGVQRHYSRGEPFEALLVEAAEEYQKRNDDALSLSIIMSHISKECKRSKRARERHKAANERKVLATNPRVFTQLTLF